MRLSLSMLQTLCCQIKDQKYSKELNEISFMLTNNILDHCVLQRLFRKTNRTPRRVKCMPMVRLQQHTAFTWHQMALGTQTRVASFRKIRRTKKQSWYGRTTTGASRRKPTSAMVTNIHLLVSTGGSQPCLPKPLVSKFRQFKHS